MQDKWASEDHIVSELCHCRPPEKPMHCLGDSNQTDSVFSALEVNETSAFTIAHLPGEAQAVLLFQKTSANYTGTFNGSELPVL